MQAECEDIAAAESVVARRLEEVARASDAVHYIRAAASSNRSDAVHVLETENMRLAEAKHVCELGRDAIEVEMYEVRCSIEAREVLHTAELRVLEDEIRAKDRVMKKLVAELDASQMVIKEVSITENFLALC
jgi:hypothetical protein